MTRVLDGLCTEQVLEVEYVIPDGVSGLTVRADLRAKTLTTSMTLGAPEDRKTAKARVNWLLRQLTKTEEKERVHVKAIYGRREDIQHPLSVVQEDPGEMSKDDPRVCPRRFEVRLISDLGRRMEGPKSFIQALEKHVPDFYTEVGQYLRPWVPSAPRVSTQSGQTAEKKVHEGTEAATSQPEQAGTGTAGMVEQQPHSGGARDSAA